jgi:hypothetical protein
MKQAYVMYLLLIIPSSCYCMKHQSHYFLCHNGKQELLKLVFTCNTYVKNKEKILA